MPILLNKTLRLFLDSIGRRDEYEFYLNKFHSDTTKAFAIICPERQGFEEVASVFTFDLDFLLRLELMPVILLNGGDGAELKEILASNDHPYTFYDIDSVGEDVTPLLASCRQNKRIPVFYYADASREQALSALIPEVARRVHIIRVQGSLRNKQGDQLFYYYTQRANNIEVSLDDEKIVRLARLLLNENPGVHISVASSWRLLEELFTVKGAGCVFKKGAHIIRCQDVSACDESKLTALFENSFGKKLADLSALKRASEIFFEENYSGAALLEKHPAGMYLSKFAVGKEARGEGLANELWREVMGVHPAIFWRAREENPINHWYEKHADGYHRAGSWRLFWKGVKWEQIPEIIQYSLDKKDDFQPV